MNNLTLIIPAKNEAESLPRVLDELKEYKCKIDVILHKSDIPTIEAIKNYNINIFTEIVAVFKHKIHFLTYCCKSFTSSIMISSCFLI